MRTAAETAPLGDHLHGQFRGPKQRLSGLDPTGDHEGVRRQARRAGKRPAEMVPAKTRHVGQIGELQVAGQVRLDMVDHLGKTPRRQRIG